MANTVTSQTLLDGSRRTILHWYLASDGVTGELTNQVIFDASVFNTTDAKIERIRGYLIGFTGLVSFDATTDVPKLILPSNDTFDYDFREGSVNSHGIANDSGTGKTGDVLLTTTGFTAAGDIGWLEITLRKD